ncbi:MAG: Unknown protein [uncultured Sulfurovum sp.]|uniref:PcfJ-like protein n=1 Tax=uncultured Sulfurovum sp. TaxID=269237 RepID=A0A6S6SHH4_9BACT|nr:MAG: Unknown protein [uncultured Sulfurovum sp.]
MQNSWYLKKNGIHHFFCKCGEHNSLDDTKKDKHLEFEIIDFNREVIENLEVLNLYYYPDNHCSSCHNEYYLDVNALLFDDRTRYWRSVKWYYKKIVTDEFWKVIAFVKIPKVTTKTGEIAFEELELSNYTVTTSGVSHYDEKRGYFFKKSIMIDGNYHRVDRIIKEEMSKQILELLRSKPNEVLRWLNGRVESLDDLIFFLKNHNIRFIEILKWKNREYFLDAINQEVSLENSLVYFRNHRNEKSIQKVQFNSYKQMMHRYDEYNPMVDYIFSRSISDVNHLHRALGMNIEIKYKLFNGSNIESINHFIDFLKRHYQEKHIVQLWLNVSQDDLYYQLVQDSINLFSNKEMRDNLNANFQKRSLNIRAVHHELTRHSRRLNKIRLQEMSFSYNDSLLKTEVTREGISYQLPKNNKELYKWGELLHNCLSSYSKSVLNGHKIIFALFIENQLTYAIELRNHKIVQMAAIFNSKIIKSERAKIDRWHKEVYLKNSLK